MMEDSGTPKENATDLKKPADYQPKEGLSKDEIDSIADLIGDDPKPEIDLDDTGRFTR